jgi:glycosyltransferase involved in cell wall biosynthesis
VSIKVSVLTSVLNQSEWLRESIASVVASTFKDWEQIVVDDGSVEDIKAVVESFNDSRIRYFQFPENRGIPHGTNFALSVCAGKYVCLLAADEVISPDKLQIQYDFLEANPKVDACWGLPTRGGAGHTELYNRFGERPLWEQNYYRAHNRSRYSWMRTLLNVEGVPIGGCSLMIRRDVMRDLGAFDTNLKIFSDHEFYVRFFEAGHIGVILPHVLALDKPGTVDCVRFQNAGNVDKELAYVREKHPIPVPPTTGTVTIGIPCYNMAKFLPDAVRSVFQQTADAVIAEVLVFNDGSTDNFKEVAVQLAAEINDPRLRFLGADENIGQQEAMNYMAFTAKGDFYVSLAADDKMHPMFVERCMAKFSENPWHEFVATQTDFYLEDWTPYTIDKNPFFQTVLGIPKPINRSREDWLDALRPGNHYFGAGMYRTYAIREVGGWKTEMGVISDYEMYVNLLQREPIGVVEENLTHTRLHGENSSITKFDNKQMEKLPLLYHAARKPYYRPLMKVVIATPFYELKGFSPYIASLVETIRILNQMGIDWRFMELSGDSYVHRARNTMCDTFLRDPDATDLFFIDSDMSWDPRAFVQMCLLPDDIVGGSYPVKNGWDNWTSIPKLYEEGGATHYKGRELGDGTALLEAHVLAGGFLRIKRHVLENFRKHYPDLWYIEPSTDAANPDRQYTEFFYAGKVENKFYGEDHYFSKRMREMGALMMIYPNATISHFGVKGWTGNLDQFLKQQKKAQEAPQPQAS